MTPAGRRIPDLRKLAIDVGVHRPAEARRGAPGPRIDDPDVVCVEEASQLAGADKRTEAHRGEIIAPGPQACDTDLQAQQERGSAMPTATTDFASQKAPCGRNQNGQHVEDSDDDGLVSDDYFYSCGCRKIHHEMHDGSVTDRVVRHDGRVMVDELEAETEHHH